jgi:hypothetical protein
MEKFVNFHQLDADLASSLEKALWSAASAFSWLPQCENDHTIKYHIGGLFQ